MIYRKVYASKASWTGASTFTGAMYDEYGCLIENSLRVNSHAAIKHKPPSNIVINEWGGKINSEKGTKYCYCGHFHVHFGHFLVETLSSLYLKFWLDENVKFLFHPFRETVQGWRGKEYIMDSLRFLGISPDRIEIIGDNSIYENVMILPRPVAINSYLFPDCLSVYEKIGKSVEEYDLVDRYYNKIYLSRSGLINDPRATGIEKKIDNLFESLGFKIFYPETLKFGQQVALVKNATILAGQEGSALHLSMFMPKGGKVISLVSRQNNNVQMCNDLSGVDTCNIFLNYEQVSRHIIAKIDDEVRSILQL